MADVSFDPDNKNPKELLGQGIRAYILQDYNTAVQALSKASEILVTEHGDDRHDSLGDVYLYYGKSLLELSREESEALGDAVPKNAEESDEENGDGEDDQEENDESEEKKEENGEKKTEAQVNGTADENKINAEKEEVASSTNEVDDKPSASEIVEETTDEPAENEDEPTDLQVAWEVLELAKQIFDKRGTEGKKHLAETLIVLGEVALESENYESAVNDVKQGLVIQKELFGKDSRTVAETCYKLGIVYSTNSQIEEAVESFNESLECLKNRINVLESVEDKKDDVKEEIDEIKGLVPDIEERIADMKNYKEEALKKLTQAVTEPKQVSSSTDGAGSSSATSSSSSKQATDISHLVKRKRKVEDSEKVAEQICPPKKPSP